MRPSVFALLAPLLLLGTVPAAQPITIGNDLYVGADAAEHTPRSGRDLFSAGPVVALREAVDADAHVAGFSVLVGAETGRDLYAIGGNVRIDATVGDDLSAMGFSVTLGPDAAVGANARLSGGSVRIEAPIAGSLAVTAGSILLDARVEGDAWIAGRDVKFGPNAAVAGTVHVASAQGTTVPETVAPPDRVVFERIDADDMPMHAPDWAPDWTKGWMRHTGGPWTPPHPLYVLGGTILTLAFLLALGAAALALAPERTETLRKSISRHPWIAVFSGILGVSAVVGLIPVAAVTLIGLPMVPIVVLALILLWTLGYLLGIYAVSRALFAGLTRGGDAQGMGMRLGALALGLAIATVLNFVPLLGWMANLVLGFLGVGAIVEDLFARMTTTVPRA